MRTPTSLSHRATGSTLCPRRDNNSPITFLACGRWLHSRARIARRLDPSLQIRHCPPRAVSPPKPTLTRRT
jgi:hypothetical protein